MANRSRLLHSARQAGTGALALMALLALAGCVPQGASPRPTPSTTGDSVYTAQTVTWEDCDDGLQCAEVQAPTDWDDPASEPITLALARQPAASGTAEGVLFVNPGGPGGSGVEVVRSGYAVTEAAADRLDVVGWDPRGVGDSSRVVCGDNESEDRFLYGTFDAPYDTAEWVDQLAAATAEFAAGCAKNTGDLLAHVDTASTAKDLELLRVLLGDQPLNYLGYSYGTQIGETYAELFPERVGRMVLDGVVDPTLGAFESIKYQYVGFDSALRAYVEDCLTDRVCPFTGTADEALARIDDLIGTAGARHLVSTTGREVDEATIATGVALALYSETSWPDLTEAFTALLADDVDPILTLADYYNEREVSGDYASNSVDVYNAVNCVDQDWAADGVTTLEGLAELEKAAPILGRYFAYDDWAVLDVMCSNWPAEPADLPEEFDAAGAAPIMVIGTTNDPATPYSGAQSVADMLESGFLVTYQGEGHTVYNSGVACIDDTVDAFLLEGTVPDADPMC